MGRVVHFEITADDTRRAVKFYQDAFGWKFEDSGMSDMDYQLAHTGDEDEMGIDGAIMPRTYHSQPVINTIGVENLEEALEKVKAAGGQLEGDIQPIPEVGRFSYVRDTEGNLLGVIQPEMRNA
jgi:predicted enzyme related to lactoylglutathione lyase